MHSWINIYRANPFYSEFLWWIKKAEIRVRKGNAIWKYVKEHMDGEWYWPDIKVAHWEVEDKMTVESYKNNIGYKVYLTQQKKWEDRLEESKRNDEKDKVIYCKWRLEGLALERATGGRVKWNGSDRDWEEAEERYGEWNPFLIPSDWFL